MEITGDEGAALDAAALTSVLQTDKGTFQVSDGMEAVGSDGGHVGHLHEVRPAEGDLLVRRPLLTRDVYIPFEAIAAVRDGALMLTVPADEVVRQGWPHRPLLDLAPD